MKTVQRHAWWDQIINGQVKRHHGGQMSRLIKGGTQREVMAVLPDQAAQRGEAFTFIQRIGLL
ncbi:hypothetical protein D3C81_2054180 [compost metagenome]